MTDLLLGGGVLGCIGWLTALTVRYRRHLRHCVDGEPVYRQLPDGRVRFSWAIAARLAECECAEWRSVR
jgi:hypothetical protein